MSKYEDYMRIISDPVQMQSFSIAARREGKRISFVPTMGFLHEGHASLLREGRRQGDILVLSIFVNPIQFGVNEDLDRYPRDMERDCRIADECGVDVVFAPNAADMYPSGFQTGVTVRDVSLPLCGANRPGHFDGVATVVTKLFNIVQPHLAFFGRKDYQQLAVIRRMVMDLSMPIEIVGMPIVREKDGLAMSSRNSYLLPEQRRSALCLHRAITAAREMFADGERRTEVIRSSVLDIIGKQSGVQVEYAEFRDGVSLEEQEFVDSATLLALAVRVGQTRLIDNTVLGEGF